jgi:Ca2+-binding RTX toxin-like protein
MSIPGQIFEWEGITQPSYWGGQAITDTGHKAMDQIAATGASTLTLVPNFFQTDKFSNSVGLNLGDPNNPWDNESDTFAQVRQSILDAKARGLNVVLKPHLETNNRVWRAELAPTDPKAWFDSYKAMMVEYAKVAQEAGAAMICVGTEMDSMIDPSKVCSDGKSYTQKWVEIIEAVRAVYSGKVTYAATYGTVKDVGFWDQVDYIGVDAYIPSSTVNDPTVDQIVDAWTKPHFNPWIRDTLHGGKSVVEYYKALSEQYGKKVIFTEVGYKSMDGANKDPGVFGGSGTVDLQEQVDCYTALYKVMENYGGQWLAGSFLWSYYSFENPMEERGVAWTDYTTQWKPANGTVTTHYSSPAHVTGLVWNGTSAANKLDGGYHNDTLEGAGGNDMLWGGAGHDRLNGGTENDVLTGGFGNDILDGGAGDQDRAVFSGRRTDYSVTKNQDGSFTVLDNRAGGDGRDIVSGIEAFQFADGIVPPASVPDSSPGSQDQVLIGTRRADKLVGGVGNDKLYGKLGKDVLTGGTGKDIFVFDTKPKLKKANLDKITDFNVVDDTLWIDNALCKKLGKGTASKPVKLNKKFFSIDKAKDGNDYLIYNKKTGLLSLDIDGSGLGKAVEIAVLKKGLKLSYNDFFVV